jgi:hypothetical protein
VRSGEKAIRLRPVLDLKTEIVEEALKLIEQECHRLS